MDVNFFKDKLTKEQDELISSMSMLGKMGDVPGDWVVVDGENDKDFDSGADMIEERETNQGILDTLEERLLEVQNALGRIESGTYGTCSVCNVKIDKERLEANPSSLTCITHAV